MCGAREPAAPDAEAVVFLAEYRSGELALSGHISSTAHEAILRRLAADMLPDTPLTLNVAQQRPTPPGWALITEMTLRALASTTAARARVDRQAVVIEGLTGDAEAWRHAAARVERALLPDMRLDNRVTAIASSPSFADMCRRQFDGALQNRRVHFPLSGTSLGTATKPLLDALVEVVADCPSARIVVTGHTDASGSEAANRALSTARAQAVVRYMSDHGIDPARLEAEGRGSSELLDSADTASARARNRRIEFRILF